MKYAKFGAVIGSLALSLGTACGSDSPATPGGASGGTTITPDVASNYSFWSKITLASLSVAEKSTLTFDWSGVTQDMYHRPINPKSDVGGVLVTIWAYTKADLETKINNDQLVTRERKGAGYLFTGGALDSTNTDALTSDGATLLPPGTKDTYFSHASFPAPEHTFLVMVQRDPETPGKEALILSSFSLSTDTASPTSVILNDASTDLQFNADFSKLTPTRVPVGSNDLLVDWSNFTTNAMGHEVDPYKITRVLVARYTQTTSELQTNENFPELESLAGDLWESNPDDILSTKLPLTKLKNSRGEVFAGIDDSHTWILALACGECLNPAPWYITVLQP